MSTLLSSRLCMVPLKALDLPNTPEKVSLLPSLDFPFLSRWLSEKTLNTSSLEPIIEARPALGILEGVRWLLRVRGLFLGWDCRALGFRVIVV